MDPVSLDGTIQQVTPHATTSEPETPLPLPSAEVQTALVPSMCGATAYFKRFRMEATLFDPTEPVPPPGFTCVPWSPVLLDAHAETLHASFQDEIDAVVFASLGDRAGCRSLMSSIVARSGFVPEATWLLVGPDGPCGTVQGIREQRRVGSIQNLGVLARYRGHGLGTLLLRQAMAGFRALGLDRTRLEVTAQNSRAELLYRRLGFRRIKTIYKPVNGTSWGC